MSLCEACGRGDHANCGMQTWCQCDCDSEAVVSWSWPDDDPDMPEDEYFDRAPCTGREACGCKYCFCMNETEYGETCGDCLVGAHQG